MLSSKRSSLVSRLPDFIVIGATKAGTTSLDFYLSLHPEIHVARPKEPRFFVDMAEPTGRWGRGVDWYQELFRTTKRMCGEASPVYTHYPALSDVPERMARLVPGAKLIYVVREPMERLKSHHLMLCRQRRESSDLDAVLAAKSEPRCLLASCYGSQLEKFLEWFPLEQIYVLESEDLSRNRMAALRCVFEFLGVDPGFTSPLFRHRRNVTGHQRIPSATGRKLLDSRGMRLAQDLLPDPLFYHLKNLLLRPFAGKQPSMELSEKVQDEIHRLFRTEMSLLRRLCGQSLPSLGFE